MTDLNRELQKKILLKLKELYPCRYNFIQDIQTRDPEEQQSFVGNLFYLQELLLIQDAVYDRSSVDGSNNFNIGHARITAKGMDFLEDDGGISAILETRVVKLHEDSIKSIFLNAVLSSRLPSEEKSIIIEKIKAMPVEVCTNLITKGIEKILDVDALIHLIDTF